MWATFCFKQLKCIYLYWQIDTGNTLDQGGLSMYKSIWYEYENSLVSSFENRQIKLKKTSLPSCLTMVNSDFISLTPALKLQFMFWLMVTSTCTITTVLLSDYNKACFSDIDLMKCNTCGIDFMLCLVIERMTNRHHACEAGSVD